MCVRRDRGEGGEKLGTAHLLTCRSELAVRGGGGLGGADPFAIPATHPQRGAWCVEWKRSRGTGEGVLPASSSSSSWLRGVLWQSFFPLLNSYRLSAATALAEREIQIRLHVRAALLPPDRIASE